MGVRLHRECLAVRDCRDGAVLIGAQQAGTFVFVTLNRVLGRMPEGIRLADGNGCHARRDGCEEGIR